MYSGNSLSLLGAQNKDHSTASQTLLTWLNDVCNEGYTCMASM